MITSMVVLVALTIALMQGIKQVCEMPDKFKPLIAVIVGVVLTFLATKLDYISVELVKGVILNGIIVGLTAVGLYDQKALIVK